MSRDRAERRVFFFNFAVNSWNYIASVVGRWVSLKHYWNYIVGKERGGGEVSPCVLPQIWHSLTSDWTVVSAIRRRRLTRTYVEGVKVKVHVFPTLTLHGIDFYPPPPFQQKRGAFYKLSRIYKHSGHSDKADIHGNLSNCCPSSILFWSRHNCYRGHAVAQLVEALRYKSEGRGFDSRCCHWNFSFT